MMQQPICQESQLGNQQPITQQMVLCPVKLVYDTQILVQPGDQIQPNQTIFINPQNPPPWIQNRMQNQVIYVQQVPNNYYQQQIDPNSVYIHNYPYQVQQQILPQNPQEQRPVQITNLAPNVMQGLPNVHNISNVQNVIQNERLVERHTHINNFGQIPQQIVPNRQAAPNLALNQVHNQIPQQTIELHRSGYVSNRPQMAVNANIRQVVNTQSMPNMQQNVRQTFASATNQQRPIQIHNNSANIQRIIQPPYTNSAQIQTVAKVLESIPTVPSGSINKPTIVTTSVSNLRSLPNYAYRPIQPRPQYRHNVPNIGVLTQPIPQMQNIQSNNNNRTKDNRINNIPTKISTVNINNTETKLATQGNRKRKSESPDEIQKKISIIGPSVSVIETPKQSNVPLKNVTVSSGINIAHTESNALNQKTILQLTNSGAQIVKLVDNGQQTMPIENLVVKNENIYPINPNEKDKLVRNTVFPQARGRVLKDKEMVLNNITQDTKPLDKPEEELNKVKVLDVIKIELIEVKNENNNLGTLKDQQEELNKSGLKQDNESSTREVQPKNEINCEQQILTHVLDGYVIQESNMAFPIRRPLKEKIIYENTKAENFEKDSKEDILEKTISTAVKETKPTDLAQLPLQNLQLDNENSDAKKDVDRDAAFLKIQPATVKSWTVDILAKHLTNYGWNETVSILQEHEIDGESLFLVSKTQLVQIGISEEHADVICEFVKH